MVPQRTAQLHRMGVRPGGGGGGMHRSLWPRSRHAEATMKGREGQGGLAANIVG